jgi:cytochrome c
MSLRPYAVLCLGLMLALSACGKKTETSQQQSAAAPAAPVQMDAATKASLAELPAPFSSADPVAGERIFARCRACHTTEQGGPDMTGPNLWGLFGRKAGSKSGYTYSDAVKNAGFTWDAPHLDKWLNRPAAFLPGTKMTFIGLPNDKDRQDLIAYLKVSTGPGAKK